MQSQPSHRVTHTAEGELGELDEVCVSGPGNVELTFDRNTELLYDSHGEQVQVGRVNHPGVARPVIQSVAQSHTHLGTSGDESHSTQRSDSGQRLRGTNLVPEQLKQT